MREKLKALYAERKKLAEDSKKVLDAADKDNNRKLTAEENAEWEKMHARIEEIGASIEQIEKQLRVDDLLAQSRGRVTEPTVSEPKTDGTVEVTFGKTKYTVAADSPEGIRASSQYAADFSRYLKTGMPAAGLQVSNDAKGGYLAPTVLLSELIKFLDNEVFMRRISRVVTMATAASLGVPSWDTDPGDADWTAEVAASDISEDDTARTGKREFAPQLLTKYVKISNRLLRTSVIDIESLIMQRLAYKFGVTEEQAFLTGTGSHRPLGIFTASTNGISTGRDTTASATTTFTVDNLIDTLYALKGQYQRNATWILHRDVVKFIRKLKDGNGQYLWAIENLGNQASSGQPPTILGRPYFMSEYAPNTFTTGLYMACVGDFSTGYWIADAMNIEIQRLVELAALKNQTGFVARKETDGAPVLEECFSRLKLA